MLGFVPQPVRMRRKNRPLDFNPTKMLGFVPQPNLRIKVFFLKGKGIVLRNPVSQADASFNLDSPHNTFAIFVGWVERSKTQRISWVLRLNPTTIKIVF
jgi:hypothetical protein